MKKVLQAIGGIFNLKVVTEEEYDKFTEKPPTVIPEEIEKPTTLLTYQEIIAMLKEYDTKKLVFDKEKNYVTMASLKHEDTRVSTFDFTEIKNYIAYVEKVADEKEITLKGLGFVKGTYNKDTTLNKDFIGYESLLYLPTVLVDGKETLIDLTNSSKDRIISFKEMLIENGYEWRYDDKTTTLENKANLENNQAVNQMQLKSISNEVLVANKNNISPPLDS